MLTPPFSFDEIMAPLGAERFFAEYEGQRPLHLKGAADKFAAVMNWARLNDLLGQATIWSQASLQLVLDKEMVPSARYCAPALGRDGGQVLRPDPDKVKSFLKRGATLVANDIDHLSPGLTAFSQAMEQALGGKVQGNLYLSSRRRQGFAAHFDTHDVYAVHVEGTKTWHVYEGRAQDPIAHPMFKQPAARAAREGERRQADGRADGAGRPAVPAARPVSRRAGRRGRGGAHRLRRHLPDRHRRDELAVRSGDRRARVPRQPAAPERCPMPTPGSRAISGRWPSASARCWPSPRPRARSPRCSRASTIRATPTICRSCWPRPRTRATACAPRASAWSSRAGATASCRRARAPRPRSRPRSAAWSPGCSSAREFSAGELAAAFPDRQPGQREQLLRDLGTMRLIEVI